MSESENKSTSAPDSKVEDVNDSKVSATTVASEEKKPKSKVTFYAGAVLIVAVVLLGVLYKMEKEDRSQTNIFGSIIASQEDKAVVAMVNGEGIVNSELKISVNQFSQAASLQGVDVTDSSFQEEVRTQALDVLINTELLIQAAEEKGLSVTDEEVEARKSEIVESLGGEEVLSEKMAELGIPEDRLDQDIKNEILIQGLLDTVFNPEEEEVGEEEILEFYNGAGGEEGGLPPMEEIAEQVKEQIIISREQIAVDGYIASLKEDAQIEIK